MAVTLQAHVLANSLGADSTTALRLLEVARALIELYAPAAPEAVQNESAIRVAGWLYEQPAAAITRESEGEISTSYAVASMSALRHSGAMALLSVWRERRAGVI